MTKRHSHAFVVWLDTVTTLPHGVVSHGQARDVHRFTHRHAFEDPGHSHEMNGVTMPSRFYDEERRAAPIHTLRR